MADNNYGFGNNSRRKDDMTEKNVDKLIEAIKEKSFVPSDWIGVSDIKVIRLNDVIDLIKQLRDKKEDRYC